jgi:lipopolysaccharide transport system permease protein
MSVVFGTLFKMPIVEYAPYILSGMVTWELITLSTISGGSTFFTAEAYIRQFNHPVTIYTLKSAVVFTINFLIALIALVIWILVKSPINVLLGLITLPLTTILLFCLSWSITTIASFFNAKYRDYPQMMTLVMQALWYMSPVFFQESMFEGNRYLQLFLKWNPVTHILYLIRKPFLYGQLPSFSNYMFTAAIIIIFGFFAYLLNRANGKRIIFYL